MRYLAILLLTIFCTSCTDNNPVETGFLDADAETNRNYAFTIDEAVDLSGRSFGDDKAAQDQKLIKESYLVFETSDIEKTYSNIVAVIKKYDGYIQDDSAEKDYYRITRRLVIRIPTANFQNTIDEVSKNVEFFDSKQTTLKDVTEEFIDLEARLKAKKELENRYLELLKKAKNVQELLEVEKELSHIREEIEAKQGRLKYLENKVSLSTINIEFYKTNSESKVTKSYGSKMWNAIVSGFDGLSSFFLGILYIWPFIIIIILAFYLIRRWIKKRNKNEKNPKN